MLYIKNFTVRRTSDVTVTATWTMLPFPEDVPPSRWDIQAAVSNGAFQTVQTSVTAPGTQSVSVSFPLVPMTRPIFRVLVYDENGNEYYSISTPLIAEMSERKWLFVREIVRRRHVQLSKGMSGVKGTIYRIKKAGERCPSCYDYDIKAPTNSHCATCLGTGFIYGYEPEPDFWIEPVSLARKLSEDGQVGVTFNEALGARCVFFPHVLSKDLWAPDNGTVLYQLGETISSDARIGDYDLSGVVSMEALPPTHVAYSAFNIPPN